MEEPSRSEAREQRICEAAEKGHFEIDDELYPSEIRSLQKHGFYVTRREVFNPNLHLFHCTISWHKPFGNAIPNVVYFFIKFPTTEKPECIDNFAKRAYIIALESNLK